MAELAPETHWSHTQTRAQFAAVAWLRWRIAVNGLRRKGGTGELVGRILISVIFGLITIVFVIGTGVGAYFFASKGQLYRTSWILWGIFLLCQMLNIQLGQPGTTFDPTQLIRFPLRVDQYVFIRLFFGLLSPANIAGTLMSLAVAVGIGIATPSLWLFALIALTVFAATNVLFSRMIFAWVDRWLSTRRAREVFTGLVFTFSLGIQWANFTFNPAYNHGHTNHTHGIAQQRLHFAASVYHRAHPLLASLPPELTTSSLIAAHHAAFTTFALETLACAVFAACFFAVFALRTRTEFRGENLSDAANAVSRNTSKPAAPTRATSPLASSAFSPAASSSFGVPHVIPIMLGKELLYVRRHMGILYGLVMPVFLVLIFASRFASRSSSLWIFPASVAYTLLAIAPLSYNSLGFEGAGSQFYFLAPVRIRDILLAKNLFGFFMAFAEILAIFSIISYISGVPSLRTAAASMLWAAGTLAINDILGNRRSVTAPKKINPQRMANKQTSQLSAFLSLGILAISSGVAAGLFEICFWFHQLWALVPVSALFATVGIGLYLQSLRTFDQFALDHREPLFAELCKQS